MLNKLRKTFILLTIGLISLVGMSYETNAQTRRQIERQRQIQRQQQRAIRQQQRRILRQQQRQIRRNNRYRVYNNGRYYQTDSRGAELLRQAVNNGYQQGVRAGQYDSRRGIRRSYTINSQYRRGNYGYRSYVDSRQYQYYFRQGFQRGYQDGYSSRYRYGRNNNGAFNILGTILNGILNIQRY